MSELYYHFVSANKHLRKGSEHENIEVVPDLKLVFNGEPVLCEQGFHASKLPLDALYYAPSDAEWMCGVRLSGTVIHGVGKSVATERTVVWMLNTSKLLVEFALWNAEQAFEAIRKIGIEPDERSIEAIRIVRLWLVDKASEEELSTATYAAADAATYTAARAARATTYTDARAADAATYAANAARSAARAATYATARAAYAVDAAGAAADAAGTAAYATTYATTYATADTADAARDAASAYGSTYYATRAAQNGQLEKMIADAFAEQDISPA